MSQPSQQGGSTYLFVLSVLLVLKTFWFKYTSLFQIHGGNRTRWTQDTAPIRNNLIFFLHKRKMNIVCTKSWGIVSFGFFSRTAQAMCLLATERRNPPPKELLDATGLTIRRLVLHISIYYHELIHVMLCKYFSTQFFGRDHMSAKYWFLLGPTLAQCTPCKGTHASQRWIQPGFQTLLEEL